MPPTQDHLQLQERSNGPSSPGVVRVGRETKGRWGKGVTIIADLPLDQSGLSGACDQAGDIGLAPAEQSRSGGSRSKGIIGIEGRGRLRKWPTSKACSGLRQTDDGLEHGDYLIFYAGLQNWDESTGWVNGEPPGLYIIGYFLVEMAGMATDFSRETLKREFGDNFHVRYPSVFKLQKDQLVLIKGGLGSRLLQKAHKISTMGEDRAGKPLKVLSPEMQKIFGDFGGHISIQTESTTLGGTGVCGEGDQVRDEVEVALKLAGPR